MSYGIKLKVWGSYACFTRPEMKVERVSYDAMTPSAARGILEAIYWKPAITWVVDRIHVLNPIRFDNIRRNELAGKLPLGTIKKAMNDRGLHNKTWEIIPNSIDTKLFQTESAQVDDKLRPASRQ